MNKVVLIGRMTKDPDLKFTAGSGKAVSKFTIAVNRQFKKDECDFINCVCFGKTAETISQYFVKGNKIAVEGHIQVSSYDAADGTKRYSTDVLIDSFDFIESKSSNNNTSPGPYTDDMIPSTDDDCPF